MKYEFISTHSHEFGITQMCKALKIKRSGYYTWKNRPECKREKMDTKLIVEIKAIFFENSKHYGSPRVHAELKKRGVQCGHNHVARLMQAACLVARPKKKYHPQTTKQDPTATFASNVLNQEFSAAELNQKWVSDITYIDTREGWLYLSAILDLKSRYIVGWAMDEHMESSLIESALKMAFSRRKISGNLLHHSDRGSQYTSFSYQSLLLQRGCHISMSRTGNCYDNAVMESFFSSLKFECANTKFPSRRIAELSIFEYIEGWYNRKRLHSSLGYLSPLEYEASLET
jgi:putative transposase